MRQDGIAAFSGWPARRDTVRAAETRRHLAAEGRLSPSGRSATIRARASRKAFIHDVAITAHMMLCLRNSHLERLMADFPSLVSAARLAGGLEALQALFKSMPRNPGMAFVVVAHLAPTKYSHMDKLHGNCTEILVAPCQASSGRAEPCMPDRAGSAACDQKRRPPAADALAGRVAAAAARP